MITRKTRRGMIALVLLSAFSFWVSRSQDQQGPKPVAGLDPELDYVLHDFELQFFDEFGKPAFNMRAPVLRNDPRLQLGTIDHPVVSLNQADAVWNLTADTATVTTDKEHVQLLGQVHVRRNEPASGNWVEIDTREVQIEVTPQTAFTDQPVHIFDGRNRVDAVGLELDMKTKTYILKHQVKASYAVN
ncbi:MAG: LPS export ABC transporter periplasmic protein LptC [Lysobacterales bacterium]